MHWEMAVASRTLVPRQSRWHNNKSWPANTADGSGGATTSQDGYGDISGTTAEPSSHNLIGIAYSTFGNYRRRGTETWSAR